MPAECKSLWIHLKTRYKERRKRDKGEENKNREKKTSKTAKKKMKCELFACKKMDMIKKQRVHTEK